MASAASCVGHALQQRSVDSSAFWSASCVPPRAGTSVARVLTFASAPGNALKAGFISEPCYNLVYLELAACRLTALPADLARLAPNLRNLNLNYNFLEDVRPLAGLTRMRRLTLVGSRVAAAKALVRVLRGMLNVEMLDFRYAAPARFFLALPLPLLRLRRGRVGAVQSPRGFSRARTSADAPAKPKPQARRRVRPACASVPGGSAARSSPWAGTHPRARGHRCDDSAGRLTRSSLLCVSLG